MKEKYVEVDATIVRFDTQNMLVNSNECGGGINELPEDEL